MEQRLPLTAAGNQVPLMPLRPILSSTEGERVGNTDTRLYYLLPLFKFLNITVFSKVEQLSLALPQESYTT